MINAFLEKWTALKLFDKILIYFFLVLGVLILVFHQNINIPFLRFLIYLSLVFLVITVIPLLDKSENKFIHFVRYWYIIASLTFIYWSVGSLVHLIFPDMMDHYIISFEEKIFGQLPNIWVQKYENPYLTELMQLCYAVYWFTIPVGAAIFYFKKQYNVFEYMLFFVLITFFLSYLMFVFIPVAGPRFMIMDQIYTPYKGLLLTPFLRGFVENAGLRGGAFPSSHVAVAITILFFVWKYYPKIGKRGFLPAVIGLTLATVYGQYHYFTDVVVGLAMGIIIGLIGVRYTLTILSNSVKVN